MNKIAVLTCAHNLYETKEKEYAMKVVLLLGKTQDSNGIVLEIDPGKSLIPSKYFDYLTPDCGYDIAIVPLSQS
jgi:hypothetical protein